MKRLHPAIRTGFIWTGVHQVVALCAVAAMWLPGGVFALLALPLMVADFPAFLLSGVLKQEAWDSPLLISLGRRLPGGDGNLGYPIALVFTLGAFQWFLIGLLVGMRRSRREPPQQPP